MPIIVYNVVPRKKPGTQAVAYHAQKSTQRAGRIMTEQLVDYICQNSQLPRAVVPTALAAIQKSIINFVLNGHSVTIPRLGTFNTSLKSPGATTPEAFNARMIEGVKIYFIPTSNLREQMSYGVSYRKFGSEADGIIDEPL